MGKTDIGAAITGTNRLKLRFLDSSQKHLGHFDLHGNDFKRLQTGIGFGIVTECNKSIDILPTSMTIRPCSGHIYLYAKCPVTGDKGQVVQSETELFDSSTDYFILLRKETYNELTF